MSELGDNFRSFPSRLSKSTSVISSMGEEKDWKLFCSVIELKAESWE
jgi:hypothetical protein